MALSIGAFSSGIDTETIIEGLVAASSVPGDYMEYQVDVLEDRSTQYETLQTRMTALQTALEDIDSAQEFRQLTGTSSDDTIVDVEVDGTALTGTYDVVVDTLAQSTMSVSDAFSDSTSTGVIAEGTMDITVGSDTTTITVDSSNSSLTELVATINDEVDGVRAYIMDTGTTTPYRLVIVGEDTGADYAVSLDTSGLTGSGTVPNFTETRAAQDAVFYIDGIEVNDSDNEIDGAISGVTFNLNLEAPSDTITIQVERDDEAMVEQISSVVSAYNSIITHIGTERAWDYDDNIAGAFVGETLPSGVIRSLQGLISASYESGTEIVALSQVGISTAQDGRLELDTDELEEALSDNFDEVVALFTDPDEGFNVAMQGALDVYTDSTEGLIDNRIDSLDDEIEALEDRIDRFEDTMDDLEERLRARFTMMEIIISQSDATMTSLKSLLDTSDDD